MKVNQTMRETVEWIRPLDSKSAILIAIIPTLIFATVIIIDTPKWDILRLFLFPFTTFGLYLFFSRYIYEAFFPLIDRKIKRFFNAPNRIDTTLPTNETLQTHNNLASDTNIGKLLTQIAEDYKNLNNKKMPEVVTEIYKKIGELDQAIAKIQESAKIGYYPCNNSKCQELFNAKGPDDIFTTAMREKCEYCDILNMTMFRRKNYICDFCGEDNYIFWHHKGGHTGDEVRLAERKFG